MEWWTCVILLCVTSVLADDEWLEVTIAQGTVRGRKHPSGELYAFYNIPYASAPIGVNKFKPPLPPPTWSEPFDAINDRSVICPQMKVFGYIPENAEMKEDCLIANVFVPNTPQKKLSVFVYVHGGGFYIGHGNKVTGTQFINEKKDFIMVTFNYRLGVHGFLCLGTEDIPGNAGMKDQVALLLWVQENIASFGGNPDVVTIAGYSSGSASVDLLMLSKSAEGLFHKAIPESGGSLAAFSVQRDPIQIAKSYARDLDFANVDDIGALEQFYKTVSIELLTSENNLFLFENRTDATFLFSPCVERDLEESAFLTASPLSILKKGDFKKLPVLYGFANMEGLMRIEFFDVWKQMMNEKFSDFLPADLKFKSDAEREAVANSIKTFYFDNKPVGNDNILKYVDFFSDVFFTYPMLWATKLYVEAGNNRVYLYEYSFVDENAPVVPHTSVRGADHCAQSAIWWDGGRGNLVTPDIQKMRKNVREIWHNFMKTGEPVPAGRFPLWPPVGADRSPHMVLDKKLKLREVLLENRTRFWDDIYQKYYLDAVAPHSRTGGLVAKNIFIYNLPCLLC